MKIFILFLMLCLNLYGNPKLNKIINEFNKNAKPHFEKSGCLNDTLKYLKKHNLKPYIYIENTRSGYEIYCNSFWVVEDEKNKKYYSVRALVENFHNFKEYQKSIKAKLIMRNHYRSNKYGIWWIYQKKISKTDFEVIEKNLKNLKKINYCEEDVSFVGSYNYIGESMFLQGRIIIGYPKIFKIDYHRDTLGVLDEKCEKIKEIGEFVIYLFDGNKDINQGMMLLNTPYIEKNPKNYKNKLIYEKIERDNKELNVEIVRKFKEFLIKFLKFYEKCVINNGDK